MKRHKIFTIFLLCLVGCTYLTADSVREWPDQKLFATIEQHQEATRRAGRLKERHQRNFEVMVAEAKRRYPGWNPDSGIEPYGK